MPLHFAPARVSGRSALARILTKPRIEYVANDNGEPVIADRIIEAALRHFAEHGLGAARDARTRAERAFFANDMIAYDWWLDVCRTLDRRMADGLEQNAG